MGNNIYENTEDTDILEGYYPEKPLSIEEEQELSNGIDKKIKSNRKSVFKILSHLKALKKYMLDKEVSWVKKSVVIAALVYFVTPIDAIPDFAPFLGYLDDIGVIAWTIKFLGSEIQGYYD